MILNLRHRMTLVSVACIVAAMPLAYAQELEEVVVTAQKREQTLFDVPLSVQVLSGADIERAGINNMSSLMQITPSLNFNMGFGPSANSFAMRGISSAAIQGGLQPAVSMLVDGVALARQGEFVLNLLDLERVEVLRGPQGTLFGKNSTSGAINIVNRRPTAAFESSLQVSATDDKEFTYRAMLSGPFSEKVRGRLVGYHRDLAPFIKNFAAIGHDFGDEKSNGVAGKLEFLLSDNVNLLVSADWNQDTAKNGQLITQIPLAPAAGGAAQQAAWGSWVPRQTGVLTASLNDFAGIWSRTYGVSGDLSWDLGNKWSLKSITAFRSFEEDTENDVDGTPAGGIPGIGLVAANGTTPFYNSVAIGFARRPVDSHYYEEELRARYAGERFDWTIGAFYQDYKEDITGVTPLVIFGNYRATRAVSDYTDKTVAAFTDLTAKISDRVEAFGGVRYTKEDFDFRLRKEAWVVSVANAALFDPIKLLPRVGGTVTAFTGTTSDSEVTGRLGLRFTPSPEWTYYVSAAHGYKGPGIDLSPAATTAANAVVKAETVNSFEVGFKSRLFARRLLLDATVWKAKTKNLQNAQIVPGTVETRLLNAGDVDGKGVELDLTAAISNSFRVQAGAAYTKSTFVNFLTDCFYTQTVAQGCGAAGTPTAGVQNVSGKQVTRTPKFKYNVSGTYTFPVPRFSADGFARLAYVWQDKQSIRPDIDPENFIDAYGLLDASIGMTTQDGRFEVSLFGKNLTDENFELASIANAAIARRASYYGRGSKRYFGIDAKMNFK